jgi:hypothetical protein
MKSDRGLEYLVKRDFSKAVTYFEVKMGNHKDLNAYYYAVSKLGELLEKMVEHNKIPSKFTYDKLLEKKSNDHLKELDVKSHSPEVKKTTEEFESIRSLFVLAKKAVHPKLMPGIENALGCINRLIEINNSLDPSQRIRGIYTEFLTFQILYTTKWYVSQKLISFKNGYLFSFSMPRPVKNLKNILNSNKEDLIYLSHDQINQLYKEHHIYRYNASYHDIFKSLEECILFLHHDFYQNNENYIDIFKQYPGHINIGKVIILHNVYSDKDITTLRIILDELNKYHLLDNIFANLKEIIIGSDRYWESIKNIEDVISNNPLEHNDELLSHLFHFALDRMPPPKNITHYQFRRFIAHVKNSCMPADNKINVKNVYIYLDLLPILSDCNDAKIDKMCDLMSETENAIGSDNFIAICEKIVKYKIPQANFIAIMNHALQLSKDSAIDLLQLIDKHHDDLDRLKDEISDICMREYQLKYPERPLEDVIHDFRTKSNDVEYPINDAELKSLETRYLQIKKICERLLPIVRIGLQSELRECRYVLNRNPKHESAQLNLFAIIRLQIKEKMGINPYNLQMLNLLALINEPRRIAQIKTGEGKSTLIAMLAAYYGLMNHAVDIITTSDDLAIRDAEKFKLFFKSLGLAVGHNINQRDSDDCYKNAIVYGTVSEFEFAYLRGETGRSSSGRGMRSYDVAIVDEVDSMFIDMQRNQAILSRSSEEGYQPHVYQAIWEWVEKTERKEQTKENLQAMLKSNNVEINLELATTWLKSAKTAQIYSEDKEYIVDLPESKSKNRIKKKSTARIKIVDKLHTGQVAEESTRWQGGLHQLLEAKHKLEIRVESQIIGSISHIEYFNKYPILSGVTGTLGSMTSREELEQLYKVSTYDSPPYKPSLKIQIPHVIEKDQKAHMIAIKKTVQEMNRLGRPVLVLCEDIDESKHFMTHLSKEIKSVQVYNGVQALSADSILGLSGNPGVVTIATNCAGRGSDITTTPLAEEKGGLHVVVTFPAINLRVEKQAFGRTGRQGKKGTYHYILREDQLSHEEKKGKSVEEKISLMHINRNEREQDISRNNICYHNLMHKLFIIQTIFFALPMNIKENHMVEWAKLKTDSGKRTTQYMRQELEGANDDTVILEILEKFNEFWKTKLSILGAHYKTPLIFVESQLKHLLHSKQLPQDEYIKNILIEAIIFLKDPKFIFSDIYADILIKGMSQEIIKSLKKAPENGLSAQLSQLFDISIPSFIQPLLTPLTDQKDNLRAGK